MEITLKNFKSLLPADLIKKAEQNIVRECDEISKGHFQAYVDEKDQTFDTFLVLNDAGGITKSGCECPGVLLFCRHQTALLLFLAKEKKPASKLKIAKKINSTEALINEADPEKIKTWLLNLFQKNKELEIAFMHEFTSGQQLYEPAEIKKLTLDTFKAIAKRKRNLEAAEVKKIVELWPALHESAITDYHSQPGDENSFLRLNAILEVCEEIQSGIYTSSSRFNKYQETILLKIIPILNQIRDEKYWDKAVEYFVEHMQGAGFNIRKHYLSFLWQLHQLSNTDRKKRLAINLVSEYIKVNPQKYHNGNDYTSTIFSMVVDSDLFEDYYLFFKPLHYQNEYNILLISLLIKHDFLLLAEKYCLEQINANAQELYDRPYLEFLIEIYNLNKDDEKLCRIFKMILPQIFDFNIYLFIEERMEDGEDKRKWRRDILTRSRLLAKTRFSAMLFSFNLLAHENNYKKMIDYIDESASYEIIANYADEMILSNRNNFLKQLLSKPDNFIWNGDQQELEIEEKTFFELFHTLLKHYSTQELKLAVKEKMYAYYTGNRFVVFTRKQLN